MNALRASSVLALRLRTIEQILFAASALVSSGLGHRPKRWINASAGFSMDALEWLLVLMKTGCRQSAHVGSSSESSLPQFLRRPTCIPRYRFLYLTLLEMTLFLLKTSDRVRAPLRVGKPSSGRLRMSFGGA